MWRRNIIRNLWFVPAGCRGLSSYTPSLALLSEQLLQRPLRGRDPSAPVSSSQQQPQHDSREDASVSLALVQMELGRGTPTPPLDPPELKVYPPTLYAWSLVSSTVLLG
jgi:hypothetical protein